MSGLDADKLRELKKLLDEGIITKEEFEEKKKEFLEEISDSTDSSINDNDRSEDNIKYDLDNNSNKDPYNEYDGDIESPDKNFKSSDTSNNKNSYKIGAIIVAIVAIVAIFGIYISHKDNDSLKPANSVQTQGGSPTSSEWKDFDNKSWNDFKELNDNLNDLKKTVNEASSPERTEALENAEHYFSDKKDTLNYDSNDEQEKYLEPMKNICEKAEDICENALKTDNSRKESALSEIKGKLSDIENDLAAIVDGRHSILDKAGYTEQEIKDIFDKIKEENVENNY